MCLSILTDEDTVVPKRSAQLKAVNQSVCTSSFCPLDICCPGAEQHLIQLHIAERGVEKPVSTTF